MAARSFPKPPTLVQPVYCDMDAQLADARQEWARMRDVMMMNAAAGTTMQQTGGNHPSLGAC